MEHFSVKITQNMRLLFLFVCGQSATNSEVSFFPTHGKKMLYQAGINVDT